jgi:hypothetical protein
MVTGLDPDETTISPKRSAGLVQGAFEPGSLVLRMEVDRIDWILGPRDRDGIDTESFPTLGPAEEATNVLSRIGEKWLARNDLPVVGRMAFGAVLLHPEPDPRTAYSRLPDYVPVRVDPASTDFLYQINLPVQSATGIEGLRLNRLSRWSVGALNSADFTFTSGAIYARSLVRMFALRLEVDINTTPDFAGSIPSARLVEVFRELVESARTIAARGVIAP